jgi:DNA-binding response OmpR family regulator
VIAAARVLIVEDEPDLADNLLEILAEFGAAGAVVATAERALELLACESFQGVLTDFRLPGTTGVELIQRMRQRGIETPVVLVSAFLDEQTTEAAEAAGALDILCKPVDMQRLARALAEFGAAGQAVLLVEDNADLADNLAEALQSHGLSTIVANTARDALALRRLPGFAIVDLRLPDQDGISVARRLSLRDPRVRVLFVSGYTHEFVDRLRGDSAELRPVDNDSLWMEKPCDVRRLARRVWQAAERG